MPDLELTVKRAAWAGQSGAVAKKVEPNLLQWVYYMKGVLLGES